MKFMVFFVIWQFVFYIVAALAIKHLSNYENKSELDKKKIDHQIHLVAWGLGIAVPIAVWLAFAFLAVL
jgi:heme/copper-type cytochrome/quinol oxidase subunit 2